MRRFIAVVLLLVWIPIASVSLWVMSAARLVNDAGPVTQILRDNQVYETVLDSVIEQGMRSPQILEVSSRYLKLEQVEDIVRSTFSADWLEDEVQHTLAAFFNWFNGREERLNATIDLLTLKEKGFDALDRNLDDMLRGLPACTGNDKFLCRPSGASLGELRRVVNSQADSLRAEIDEQIPDDIDVAVYLKKDGLRLSEKLDVVRESYLWVKDLLKLLPIVLIGWVLLIGFIIWRPLVSVLRWIATSLVLVGVLAGGLALVIMFVPKLLMTMLPAQLLSENNLSTEVMTKVSAVVIDITNSLAIPVAIYSGIGILIAVVLYILAGVLQRREQ